MCDVIFGRSFDFGNDYAKFKVQSINDHTVPFVSNDHSRDPKFVVVVDSWSLFRGRFILYRPKLGLKNGGRCRQVVATRR